MKSNQTQSYRKIRKQSADELSEYPAELHLNINDLKPALHKKTLSKSSSIVERLLEKHSKSQAKISQKRLESKAKELQSLKPAPRISANSSIISLPRYNTEVKELVEKLKLSENTEKKPQNPDESLNRPNINYIKEIFETRGSVHTEPAPVIDEIKPSELTLLEKCEYFLKKKENRIQEAQKVKFENLVKECTFKPNLSKITLTHRKSQESLPEFFTEEKSKREDSMRSPAPKPYGKRIKSQSIDQPNILNSYVQLSPTKRVYGFKEGVNMKELIMKSKPMLRYNVVTSTFK